MTTSLRDYHAEEAWFTRWSDNPRARIWLYCLPHAGGTTNAFRTWRGLLPPEIGLCPIEYPGHGVRMSEPLMQSMDDLGDAFGRVLSRHPPRPYALFGHSMGSLVALATCHRLMDSGAPSPIAVIMAAHGSPYLPQRRPWVHDATDTEFVQRLREIQATPQEALESPEILETMLSVLRADFRACETYRPQPRRKLRMCLFAYGGLADPHVQRAEMESWRDATEASCVVRMVPGDHFFTQSAASQVTALIARDLAEAIV